AAYGTAVKGGDEGANRSRKHFVHLTHAREIEEVAPGEPADERLDLGGRVTAVEDGIVLVAVLTTAAVQEIQVEVLDAEPVEPERVGAEPVPAVHGQAPEDAAVAQHLVELVPEPPRL